MLHAVRSAKAACTDAVGDFGCGRFVAELARLRLEDFHWRMATVQCDIRRPIRLLRLAIECDGHAQGLMIVDTENHASRHPPKGQTVAYVEFLTSAPWNRGTFIPTVQFGLTGYALCPRRSVSADATPSTGRVGLHSVSGSVNFWLQTAGITSFGPDATKKGLGLPGDVGLTGRCLSRQVGRSPRCIMKLNLPKGWASKFSLDGDDHAFAGPASEAKDISYR